MRFQLRFLFRLCLGTTRVSPLQCFVLPTLRLLSLWPSCRFSRLQGFFPCRVRLSLARYRALLALPAYRVFHSFASATVTSACRSCLLIKTSAVSSARFVSPIQVPELYPPGCSPFRGVSYQRCGSLASKRLPAFRFNGSQVLSQHWSWRLSYDCHPSWAFGREFHPDPS